MTRLADVLIETRSLDQSIEVYRVVCGVQPETAAARATFSLGDATLTLIAAGSRTAGLTTITLREPDLGARQRELMGSGIECQARDGGLRIEPGAANGVAVEIVAGPRSDAGSAAARLDHVALRVKDLAAASSRWRAITGVAGEQMGVHPISGGAFTGARFLLGERMMELVAPVGGVASPIADRLASHGEGVAALALPVDDVEAVRGRLGELGARVIHQDPHWLVHPKDAGGVLVQLTPRVAHAV